MRSLLLLFALWVGLCGPATLQANTLIGLGLQSEAESDSLILEFADEVAEDPIVNFELSNLSLRFPETAIAAGVEEMLRPAENPMIRAVRVSESEGSTLVDVLLKPSSSELPTPEITISEQRLTLDLKHPKFLSANPSANTEGLAQELGQRVRTSDPFLTTFSQEATSGFPSTTTPLSNLPEDDWVSTMLTMVLALLFILVLIYLLAWAYNRFLATRFRSLQGGKVQIRVVSSYHLAPKQKVVVLDINGQLFACGMTPGAINLLSVLRDEKDQSFLTQAPQKAPTVERSKAEFFKALEVARKQSQTISSLQSPAPGTPAELETTAPPPEPVSQAAPEQPTSAEPPSVPAPQPKVPKPVAAEALKTPVRSPLKETVAANTEAAGSTKDDATEKFLDRFRSLKPIR
jgi:flagellar biogenesis protein FliO